MKTKHLLAFIILPLAFSLRVEGQSTAFTYQGRLNDASGPATGLYDLAFTLYDAAGNGGLLGNGNLIAGPVTNSATPVTNGLFTASLDFGWGVFDGNARWLEIAVQPARGTNFTTLTPRQALTATPYASFAAKANTAVTATTATVAGSAGNASYVPATGVQGRLSIMQLPAGLLSNGATGVNLVGAFVGEGSNLSNLTVAASAIAGPLSLAQLPGTVLTNNASGVNLNGSFIGNGAGITNMDLRSVNTFGAVSWSGSEPVSFNVGSTPAVGDTPQSVVAADVNGDGRPDLIAAAYFGGLLTVLTNNGGGFGLSAAYVLGANPTAVATADLNHDGKPDLISANGLTNTLTVLTNNGSGGFAIAFSLHVGSSPNGVLAADVNGDGWADLISANTGDNTLTVLTNNTHDGFATAATLATGNYPRAIAAVDVNGDGRLELVSVNRLGNSLTLFPNLGNGQFGSGVMLTVGHQPYAVTSADVNNDGQPDLISANAADGTLTVLTNNGTGGFSLALTIPVGRAPVAVAAADLNWDGRVDLISVNNYDNDVMALTNDGHGGFAMAATNAVGQSPWGLTLADWNGDGQTDLATANSQDGNLSVLLNTTTDPQAFFSGYGANLTTLRAANITGMPVFTGTSSAPFAVNSTAVVTNLNADKLDGMNACALWQLGGNNVSAGQFLGSTNNQPLELWGNNARILRLEPGTNGTPNLIGGSSVNYVSNGVVGSVIAGGGSSAEPFPNSISADFSFLGGGRANSIQPNSSRSFLGGGSLNSIQRNSGNSVLVGGYDNSIQSYAPYCFLGCGENNSIQSDANHAFLGGGFANTIQSGANDSFLGSGEFNTIQSSADDSFLGGGLGNSIQGAATSSFLGGGCGNSILQWAYYSFIGGGEFNTNARFASFSVVPGGDYNYAGGQNSFAAGHRAKANYDGDFVWADSQDMDFDATATNQFCVRAAGGVQFITANTGVSIAGGLIVSPGSGTLTVTNDSGVIPGLVADGGGAPGHLRFRNALEIFPNFARTASGYLDVRDTNGTATITLNGANGSVTALSLTQTSDRNAKENFRSVSAGEILAKVAALPISEWNYKQDTSAAHIGPMAQDFYAAFAVGPDDKHITTVDESGVALAAIQGLNEKLEKENAELKARLEKLEQVIGTLTGGAK